MSRCWVIGDAAVDLIPEGNKYLKLPGGTGANVAVALARLGIRSLLVSKLGNDPLAPFLAEVLETEKVDTGHVSFSKHHKTGLIIVSVNSAGEREFAHMVKPSADSQMTVSDMPAFAKDDWLCVSAFIFAQRASREAALFAIERAKASGCVVCVDANIRVGMWDDESLLVPTTLDALKNADMAKMSEDELMLLTNADSLSEGTRKAKQWPSRIKVITRAEKGAVLLTDRSEFHIDGYDVPVVDMTGAGDAFTAAFISRLMPLESWTDDLLIDAVRFANACGALVVEKKGAMSALPDLDTVNRFMVEKNQDVDIR